MNGFDQSPSGAAAEPTRVRASVAAARVRAGRAKGLIAVGGVAAFAAALVLARGSYASHPKHPARALSAPHRFVDTVRHDLLQSGAVAPPQAPPDAQTSSS